LGTVITFIDEGGERGRITAAIAVARQWHIRGRSVLLADASADGHIRAFAEVASTTGLPVPPVIRLGAEDLRRSDQFRSLAEDRDLVIIECPPLAREVQRAALMVADLAILPCGPRTLDPWTLGDGIDLVNEIRHTRPTLRGAVLVTRKIEPVTVGEGVREALATCGLPLLDAELGYSLVRPPRADESPRAYSTDWPAGEEVTVLVNELERLMP
jgi:chromosome partitioning protein